MSLHCTPETFSQSIRGFFAN